jgi:type IV pilus assembly protein PilM
VELPVGAVTRGEVINPDAVHIALKKLWSEGKFKSKNVVLGTGNQRTLVRDLTLPKAPLRQIRDSLPSHVQSMMQMPMEGSIFDFYPISESFGDQGASVNGLLVSTEKSAVVANIFAAERAGLTAVEVELIPFALARLLMSKAQVKGTVALVDVGGSTTTIVIARDGVPWFVRIIPFGGEDLTQSLQDRLEITFDEAEELKNQLRFRSSWEKEDGITGKTSNCACSKCAAEETLADDPRTLEVLQSVSNELLGSLRNTINYFDNTRPEETVEQVFLTGGGAQLAGLAEALSEVIVLPVSQPDPFSMVTLPRKVKSIGKRKSATFSVALGLALRSLA